MDYTRYFDGWLPTVGSYDRAAILFGYGQKVEVREEGAWSRGHPGETDPWWLCGDYLILAEVTDG